MFRSANGPRAALKSCATFRFFNVLEGDRGDMRLCRFGSGSLGVVDGTTVRDVTAALDVLPACRYPLPSYGLMIAKLDRRNDHEVELAVVIGKEANNVPRQDALGYVAGYAIGLDITIRGPEERSLRKSPDSYAVLGPWLVTPDEIANPGDLDVRIAVNGEPRQSSNTKHLILGVAELIEYASSFYTLFPGDVMMTGTPEGVSPIQPGDVISAYVERIGTMEVRVRAA